jgi:hypothetical protein
VANHPCRWKIGLFYTRCLSDTFRGRCFCVTSTLAQNAQGNGSAVRERVWRCRHCHSRGRSPDAVHYTHATAYVCDHATQQYADKRCQTFTIAYIDPFIEELFLQAVKPAHLQAALATIDQIDIYRQSLITQWRQRLERARYDTSLARRRYDHVDPDNRLVAASLEKDLEDCLRQQAALDKEWIQVQSRQLQPLSETDRQSILALASDLPGIWQQASQADRKRMLRCLIRDVTLDSFSNPGFSRILVRWRTDKTSSFDVPRPRHGTPPATAVAERLPSLPPISPMTRLPTYSIPKGFPLPPVCPGRSHGYARSAANTILPATAAILPYPTSHAAMACSRQKLLRPGWVFNPA